MLGEFLDNLLLMLICYAYILIVIFVSGRMEKLLNISRKTSRKFLHAMIGNLPFIMPFFTASIYPALVAAPFILVTFLASPLSPFKTVSKRMEGLSGITEEGHHLGLVFYAVSYTILALSLGSKPYVVAAGILPMAYGDGFASIIGEKYGRRKYKFVSEKSLEGTVAMFLASFFSLSISLVFFSAVYSFSIFGKFHAVVGASIVASLVEGLSPMGFDNFTVPCFGTLAFLLLSGGL